MKMDLEVKAVVGQALGRLPYFWWGLGLMAVKYNLDRMVSWHYFARTWYLWNYIKPHGFAAIDALPPDDERFYLVMLLTSLPFLAAGIVLTVRRLRSAGWSPGWCVLFFMPIVNLVFFALLCLVPERAFDNHPINRSTWVNWLPTSPAGSALASMVVVGLAGTALACLSTSLMQNYGWGLFVALPFTMGLVSVLIYAEREPRTLAQCMGVAVLPVLFAGICLLAIAAEGLICLVMAAPIGVGLALLGGMVGRLIAGNCAAPLNPASMVMILLAVPVTMGMESQAGDAPPMLSVTTSVIIDAPADRVWPNVVAFSPITEERDWILHGGMSYPTQARIDGQGVGAIRHCIFTTGEFVEPIEVWDENHLLRFAVASQPEPMEELSPYPHLKTPHLHGYLQSHEGELKLIELADGKTRLEGTTWYTDRIWPAAYWQLWSDLLIHHIHLRVLNHIKALSEKAEPIVN